MHDPLKEAAAHFQAGRFPQAEMFCRQALTKKPNRPEALHLFGMIAHRAGQLPIAIEILRKATTLRPNVAEFHFALGNALRGAGQLDSAIAEYRTTLRLRPNHPNCQLNLGIALANSNQRDEAAAMWESALKLNPRDAEMRANLGNLYRTLGRLGEAVEMTERSLRLAPSSPRTINNLGVIFEQQGRLDDAIACYRRALALESRWPHAHSNLLLDLTYHGGIAPAELFAEHRRWNEIFAVPLKVEIRPHANDRSPDRPLRIGYVSPDFREHAVSFFIEPILAHHDRRQFEVYCYPALPHPDAVTRRLQAHGHAWRSIVGMREADAADAMRNDRIDILVDLAVHTGGHRLLVFARKPAPVQATYLGYASTTGLDAIDWRITDPIVDPPGLTESLHCEKLLRLPRTQWCYKPPADAPVVAPSPVESSGLITFGNAPTLAKVTRQVMDLWAQVLLAVPGSRLTLKQRGLGDESVRRRFSDEFARRGVDQSRLTFHGQSDLTSYLNFFAGVDICLDTFPFAGGTTTCHTLFMGVPVVTLVGPQSVSRVGASVLTNIGAPELIAQTPEQFVQIATALAGDVPRLRHLRQNLRPMMLASPLCDAPAFVRDLESAYRQIWRQWVGAGRSGTPA